MVSRSLGGAREGVSRGGRNMEVRIMIVLGLIYTALLLGCWIGLATTNFIKPKGCWIFIPFRVDGWKNPDTGKISPMKWLFGKSKELGD